MPIHDQGYRRYGGTRAAIGNGWQVIARAGIMQIITKRQMELVRTYVRDHGGGLVMLGGEESFGVGGYYHTPVEEALPVTMRPSRARVSLVMRQVSPPAAAWRRCRTRRARFDASL